MSFDMADPWFYRDEAKTARERAAAASDPTAAQTWLRIAHEYEKLADSVEAADRSQPQPTTPIRCSSAPEEEGRTLSEATAVGTIAELEQRIADVEIASTSHDRAGRAAKAADMRAQLAFLYLRRRTMLAEERMFCEVRTAFPSR